MGIICPTGEAENFTQEGRDCVCWSARATARPKRSTRPRLEPRCYLAFGRDKCIDVLTAEAFEQVAEEMLQKVRSGEMDRNEQRALAANTIEVTIDAQGRVNLDEKLREYAGVQLGSRVIVAGSFDRVEIWEPDRHDRNISSGTEQIAGAGA